MLTDKHRRKLLTAKTNADHLTKFIAKWCAVEQPPEHISHILIMLSEIPITEQRKYYVWADELYYVNPKYTRWKKFPKGWIKTTKG